MFPPMCPRPTNPMVSISDDPHLRCVGTPVEVPGTKGPGQPGVVIQAGRVYGDNHPASPGGLAGGPAYAPVGPGNPRLQPPCSASNPAGICSLSPRSPPLKTVATLT